MTTLPLFLLTALAAVGPETPLGESRLLAPGDVELRVVGGTNVLLFNLNLGGAAEVGAVRIGRGTLAIGAELDVGRCLSICSVIGALTGLRYQQVFHIPSLRLAYHFPLAPNPTLRNVDLYLGLLGGVSVASLEGWNADQLEYRGELIGPSVSAAAGISWFFDQRLFFGFEIRARVAQFTFDITEKAPSYEFRDAIETRSFVSGLNWMALLGARI